MNGFQPASVTAAREDDERQGDRVREQPLIEIGRKQDDQCGDVHADDEQRPRVRAESRHRGGKRQAPDDHHEGRSPIDPPDRAVLVLRPAGRETVGGEAPGQPGQPGERHRDDVAQAFAPARASSTRVACETPVEPRAAYGATFR